MPELIMSDRGESTLPTFEYWDWYGVDHLAKYFVKRFNDKFCFTPEPLVLLRLRIQ